MKNKVENIRNYYCINTPVLYGFSPLLCKLQGKYKNKPRQIIHQLIRQHFQLICIEIFSK